MNRSHPARPGPSRALALALAAGAVIGIGHALLAPRPALAQFGQPVQPPNPVYVDDSPAATEGFARVREHNGGGNLDEAVRVLQTILDDQADRVVASPKDPDLFVSVRAAAHELLLSTPPLLKRYRDTVGPRAERLLGEGKADEVERSFLLTGPGLEAALRLAQSQIEDARFEAARLTLEELDRHPDRAGEAGKPAAAVAALLARYLDRDEVRDRATLWARDAGVAAPKVERVPWPEGATAEARSPLAPLPPLNAGELLPKPLWTTPLSPAAPPQETPRPRANVPIPPYGQDLRVLPAVAGDTVYVNDGTTIGAWDRFTLTPRWTVAPGVAGAPPAEGGVRGDRAMERVLLGNYAGVSEDLSTVTVRGRYAVAATGRGGNTGRSGGDDRLHALDPATGRVRWTVQVGGLDPALADAVVRGPAVVSEGVVVVAGRKTLAERRLESLVLAGIDLASGRLLWARPVGSAGSMPWTQQSPGAEGVLVDAGVAYRVDRLGVVGAVEVATGRTRWVRRMPVEASSRAEMTDAWKLSVPVADGATVVAIAPDQARIVRFDKATGQIKGDRKVLDLAPTLPRYLLRSEGTLVGVGEDRACFLPLASFETARAVHTPGVPAPGVRGRAVLVGRRLLLPTTDGCVLTDETGPDKPLKAVPLDESGNILPLDNQLVVVDDARLHSYLRWEVAEGLLTDRIKADPKNPTPAVTLAELAYRAGRADRIVGAARTAMASLKDAPVSEASVTARQRLVDAVEQMLATALEPGAAPSKAPGAPARPLADPPVIRELVQILGELAVSPEEHIAHALAEGRVAEIAGDFPGAAAAYQKILGEPALAQATWRGPQMSIRGELEATRRIESLLKEHGAAVYAQQEAAAGAELAALGPAPEPAKLEALAARYPLSRQTPGLYRRAAEAHRAAGDARAAQLALEAGLRSAARQPDAPAADVGELAGQLVTDLRGRSQLAAAACVLRTVTARFPGLPLTAAGQALDAARLGEDLSASIARSMRWPGVGPVQAAGAQAIVGWRLMEPLLSDRSPAVSPYLVLESDDEVGVWAAPNPGDPNATLAKVWSAPVGEGGRAYLIKKTGDAAYVLITRAGDGTVVKIGAQAAGAGSGGGGGGGGAGERWKSQPLAKLFNPEARAIRRVPGAMVDRWATPGEGEASPVGVLVAMDDRTLALVQRSGRAAGLDLESGEVLWNVRAGVERVYDADLVAGTLALGGDQEVRGAGNAVVDLKPAVQVLDARSGRLGQRLAPAGGRVRAVRLTDAGALVAALESAVVSIDLATAQTNWTVSAPEMVPAQAVWTFGDKLLLMDTARTFWLGDLATGRMRPQALDIPRPRLEATQSVDAFPLAAVPGAGFGVATQQGLVLFKPDGELAGADALDAGVTMLRPRPAEGRALTVETVAEGRAADGLMVYSAHALDASPTGSAAMLDTRPVLLGAKPTSLALMDGRVAVTAGQVTVILRAPKP